MKLNTEVLFAPEPVPVIKICAYLCNLWQPPIALAINAAALKKIGIKTLDSIDDDFTDSFNNWVSDPVTPVVTYPYSTEAIINILMARSTDPRYRLDIPYPELIFN